MTEFATSAFGTLGVEFEGTVMDRATSRPLPIAPVIAAEAQAAVVRGHVLPDLFSSTLELVTGVCSSIDDVRSDLTGMWTATAPVLARHDAALLGMGLHPRAAVPEVEVADAPHNHEIVRRLAWPVRRSFTTGIHVHVGMVSGDEALRTAQRIRSVLPVLLALGASSPFRTGAITGLASTRLGVFDAIPRTGQMPHFDAWDQYADYCAAMLRADAVRHVRDVWWDCRPSPAIGTLEIRVLDSVADLDDMLALCALAWCMAVGADRLEAFQLPSLLSDENRWRAIRQGTEAQFLVDASGNTEPVGLVAERVVDAVTETATALGCRAELHRCREIGWGHARHQQLAAAAGDDDAEGMIEGALRSMRVAW